MYVTHSYSHILRTGMRVEAHTIGDGRRREEAQEGHDSNPRTNVDTKPRAEPLRTTVQPACVPRSDHGAIPSGPRHLASIKREFKPLMPFQLKTN